MLGKKLSAVEVIRYRRDMMIRASISRASFLELAPSFRIGRRHFGLIDAGMRCRTSALIACELLKIRILDEAL